MKKATVRIIAALLCVCIMIGAFPLIVSAKNAYYDDITADTDYNSWHIDSNYAHVWQNIHTIEKNEASGVVYNNRSDSTIKENYGQVGENVTSAIISYNYGSAGNDGFITANYGLVLYNNGTGDITDNFGTIEKNNGFVIYNKDKGLIDSNNNYVGVNSAQINWNARGSKLVANYGLIAQVNLGTVTDNLGTIHQNGYDLIFVSNMIGRVTNNMGTIEKNETYGEVYSNTGAIVENKGYVRNYEGGTITNNAEEGRVYNYGGKITNNSGTHYLQADLSIANAVTVYGEGFSSDNDIDCWLPEGESGVAVITPDEGYEITCTPTNGLTGAIRHKDGSWTVTVSGLSANMDAKDLGIGTALLPESCDVTIIAEHGENITVPVKYGSNFYDALDEAGVFTTLEKRETEEYLFRELTTKPFSEFANEEELRADSWELIDTSVTSDMTVYACFYQKIKTVSLTLGQPVAGTTVKVNEEYIQSPAPVITLADNAHCTVYNDSATWSTRDGEGQYVFFEGVFLGGETYYADFLLDSDFGYWLDDDTVVIANGAKVEESYGKMALSVTLSTQAPALLGDANGNGVVDILDATIIQRVLVHYAVANEKIVRKNGDVNKNGLDILDATQIQRYLASYSVPYDIGKPIS